MNGLDARKIPTPWLVMFNTINNIVFTLIGGVIVYLYYNYINNVHVLDFYGLLIVLSAYTTFNILSYILLRTVYNKYINLIQVAVFLSSRFPSHEQTII